MERPKFEQVPDGYIVWQWPEFQALMARMGVPQDVYSRGVTLRVYEGKCPTITHEYIASDTTKPRVAKIDTTTMVNKEWRTSAPRQIDTQGDPVIHVYGGEG